MSRSLLLPALLLGGCVTPAGQRVTVLLLNETVTCSGPAFEGPSTEGPNYAEAYPATATLQLDQADDLYMLQFTTASGEQGHTRPTVQNGLQVTVPCLAGESELVIRRASILQARRENDGSAGGSTGGGSNPPPGGSSAPAP